MSSVRVGYWHILSVFFLKVFNSTLIIRRYSYEVCNSGFIVIFSQYLDDIISSFIYSCSHFNNSSRKSVFPLHMDNLPSLFLSLSSVIRHLFVDLFFTLFILFSIFHFLEIKTFLNTFAMFLDTNSSHMDSLLLLFCVSFTTSDRHMSSYSFSSISFILILRPSSSFSVWEALWIFFSIFLFMDYFSIY